MKRISTLALLTLAASIPMSRAQAQDVTLKADVPFAFNVGNMALPAGAYAISSSSSGVIRVANVERDLAASVSTTHDFNDPGRSSKLVFEKIGEHYFLHHILCPATVSMNVDIPSWGAEKKARREAKVERGEEVLVAAR